MKKNMSNADRIIRVLIFITTLILFFTGAVSGTLAYILISAGGVLFATSLINFCPIYKILGISTCRVKIKN